MRYTVVWLPSALAELARLWCDASDRSLVSAAADHLEILLRQDGDRVGFPPGERRRRVVVRPLAVEIAVSMDDRLIQVASVWRVQDE